MKDFFDHPRFKSIIYHQRTYPNNEITERIDGIAKFLKRKCASSNSPFIYLLAQNNLKTVVSYFAIINAGYIAVLAGPEIKPMELEERFQLVPPNAIIRFLDPGDEFSYTRDIQFLDNYPAEDFRADDLEDVCTITFSAAEEGLYKAIMLTHENLIENARSCIQCGTLGPDSILCALLPYSHMFSVTAGMMSANCASGSLVILDAGDLRKTKELVEDLAKYRVTNIYSVPAMYYVLSKAPNLKTALTENVCLISGSYQLSETIFNLFLEKTGKVLYEGYGLSEAAPVCTCHRPAEKVKIGSIGKEFDCCRVRILDAHNQEPPIGDIGEICIQGKNVMKGYYRDQTATDRIIRDGWLHSGDKGSMDNEGYVYFHGLAKNMINVAGKKVYPNEVKRHMLKYQGVVDVEISPEKSELQGHTIKAKVFANNPSPEFQFNFKKWLRENISEYKLPKTYEFIRI